MKTETIKRAIAYSGKSISQVARETGQSPANLLNKMGRNSFRDSDLEAIADAIGAKRRDYFEFPDGVKIEANEADEADDNQR